MPHSKLPWRVCDKHSQTGKNRIGYEICMVDGHVAIASVLFLRHGAKRGESPKYIEDPHDKANANLIVTAVNVMPRVMTLLGDIVKGEMTLLQIRAIKLLNELEKDIDIDEISDCPDCGKPIKPEHINKLEPDDYDWCRCIGKAEVDA